MTFLRLPFEVVFADESGGNVKTPQGEYLSAGTFPVVDQGKALIGGYVNDTSRLCGGGRPAIVFGDHTRCIKYVDFPFCMGADGVKVLRPKIEANLKYLYYYLQTVKLPDAGYNRHFKYLKRTEVVLPPLPEQRRIAAILDQADALRAKRREALAQLDSLTQSIFIEMFGDPVTNPKGWPTATFEGIFSDETSSCEKIESSSYQKKGLFPVIDQGKKDIAGFCDDKKLLSPIELPVTIFGDHTRVIKHIDFPFIVGADGAKVLKAKHGVNPLFASYLLKFLPIPNLGYSRHMKEVKRLVFPIPPKSLQDTFGTRINSLEKVKQTQLEFLNQHHNLFASLQHRAFRGEL